MTGTATTEGEMKRKTLARMLERFYRESHCSPEAMANLCNLILIYGVECGAIVGENWVLADWPECG